MHWIIKRTSKNLFDWFWKKKKNKTFPTWHKLSVCLHLIQLLLNANYYSSSQIRASDVDREWMLVLNSVELNSAEKLPHHEIHPCYSYIAMCELNEYYTRLHYTIELNMFYWFVTNNHNHEKEKQAWNLSRLSVIVESIILKY